MVRTAAGLLVAGLAVYLYSVGLDDADKLASALGLIVAVAALLVTLLSRPPTEVGTPSEPNLREVASSSRSREFTYLEDVRRVAPAELRGREPELEQLKAFCFTDIGLYWRWTASPWRGKSALLSWFVLHPPPGTEVVSFFVNGRFGGHHNRDAFIETVGEQLSQLLDRPLDPTAPSSTRVARLRRLLRDAASACQARGRRLVLVVDGLDEDRLLTPELELFSIAALLPDEPLPGLKVIVAGRPDPPLPIDVPADHPLHDPATIHELAGSVHAQASEDAATRELDGLLRNPFAREVLGLITAAGGGLSEPDLAELTGRSLPEIHNFLTDSTGRTFTRRPAVWRRSTTPEVYGFAHDKLQEQAAERLGDPAVDHHTGQIDAWADRYRTSGWPEDTPEYLLRGYLDKLLTPPGRQAPYRPGDLRIAFSLAVDAARHERMHARSDAHEAALLEIRDVAAALTAQPGFDLADLAMLAFHRIEIEKSTRLIPPELPAVWARLGDFDRAERMARSIASAKVGEHADELILDVAAEQGDVARLEAAARPTEPIKSRVQATLALLSLTVANRGQCDDLVRKALDLATTEIGGRERCALLDGVGAAGYLAETQMAIEVLPDTSVWKVRALTKLAEQLVARGDAVGARGILTRAAQLADKLPTWRVKTLIEIVRSEAGQGDPAQTAHWMTLAEAAIGEDSRSSSSVWGLNELALASLEQGDARRAEELAVRIDSELVQLSHPRDRRRATDELARLLGRLGSLDRLDELLAREQGLYEGADAGSLQSTAVRAFVAAGQLQRATAISDGIEDRRAQTLAYAEVALEFCRKGDLPNADAVFRKVPDLMVALNVASYIATGAMANGERDRAIGLLNEAEQRSLRLGGLSGDARRLGAVLSRLATTAIAIGDRAQAVRLATAAADGEEVEDGLDQSDEALFQLRQRLGAIGAADQARSIGQRIVRSLYRNLSTLTRSGVTNGSGDAPPLSFSNRALTSALAPFVASAEEGRPHAAAEDAWKTCEGALSHFGTVRDQPMTFALAAIGAAGGWQEVLRLAAEVPNRTTRLTVLTRLAGVAIRNRDAAGVAAASECLGQHASFLQAVVGAVETSPVAGTGLRGLLADLRSQAVGYDLDYSLGVVQRFLLSACAYDDAEMLVDEFRDEERRAQARSEVVVTEAVDGVDDRWERLLAGMEQAERNWHLYKVASAVAQTGDYRRADAIFRRSGRSPVRDADVLLAIVESAAEAGEPEFAEELLSVPERAGTEAEGPPRALAVVQAWCLLASVADRKADPRAAGWAGQAEELVESLGVDADRVSGLIAVAEVFSAAKARLVVARAFGTGQWQGPLEVLSRIDPDALVRFAEALIERLPIVELPDHGSGTLGRREGGVGNG